MARAMAETGRLTFAATSRPWLSPVTTLRIVIIVLVLVLWEALARSVLLYRDVVPSLGAIGQALGELLTAPIRPCDIGFSIGPYSWFGTALGPFEFQRTISAPELYCHLGITFYEIGAALLIGGLS